MKEHRSLKNFIKDILLFAAYSGLSGGFYYVALFYEDADVVLMLRVIATIFLFFALKRFLLILAHNKKMEGIIKSFFKGLGDLWQVLQDKIRHMFPEKKGSGLFRIKGYKDEVYRYCDENGVISKKKKLKWKELKTNSERVRYLYADFLRKRVKKGFPFRYSDTPAQVRGKLSEEYRINPVFDYYHEARYSEAAEISDETLENIMRAKI